MNDLTIEYHQDFYSWLCHNISLLRNGRLSEIDVQNIAEELEGMSKSQHRELVNRLKILFVHLLKWQFQTERRSSNWKGTIIEQRSQIKSLLKTSPGLEYQIEDKITDAYTDAIEYAALETGLLESDFPQTCPYPLDLSLDRTYYPDSGSGHIIEKK